MNIIQALNVYDVNSPKIRLGNPKDGRHDIIADGGYVINQTVLDNSHKLITLGYGGGAEFEMDWLERTSKPVDIYDGTCDCLDICEKYAHLMGSTVNYFKNNVGIEDGWLRLDDILQNQQNILLKADIEGAEYGLFNTADLSNVVGIVIEIHHLDHYSKRAELIEIIKNKLSEFVLYHIHANSFGHLFTLYDLNAPDGSVTPNNINGKYYVTFPETLELSFIHKNYVTSKVLETQSFPVEGLDFSNNHLLLEDYRLPWVNKITRD